MKNVDVPPETAALPSAETFGRLMFTWQTCSQFSHYYETITGGNFWEEMAV